MKAILIVDSPGPNPDYDPPNPKTDPDAAALYDVPSTRIVKAGTELVDPMVWVHCLPDYNGVVRAKPADEACAAMVARALLRMAPDDRRKTQKRIDAAIAAAEAREREAAEAAARELAPDVTAVAGDAVVSD
jgi:hypothetical protein